GVLLPVACSSNSPNHAASAPSSTAPGPTASAATAVTTSPTTTALPAPCAPLPSASKGASGGKDTNPPGDVPDNQAFVTYSPPAGGYQVKVPEGWARTDGPNVVSFTDKFNTVRVELVHADQAPTVESARSTELPHIMASAACFE